LLASIANFSEGRRGAVIDALCAAIEGVGGVRLLDRHSDADHNRSVLTLAGPAAALAEAAFQAAAVAVDRIDLNQHAGIHPRMGAVDVIPFVPLGAASVEDAAATARRLGSRLGAELALPVYLYGGAAAPGRPADLRSIRGDGFEDLMAHGTLLPPPDFGPEQLHPTAGAVAVGARGPLLAFNVVLDTDQVEVAQRIARRLRESSGGLPGVQALGLALEAAGKAQVSMNLLDYRRTGLDTVMARLKEAAAAEGVALVSAELVGLAPAEALAGLEDERLPGIPGPDRGIEARLRASGL
jgi:glutamate formiminotransferase